MNRILAPGGRYITYSLHPIHEVDFYFEDENFHWKISTYNVKSSRWDEDKNRHKSIAHSMIVCDKIDLNGNYNQTPINDTFGILTDEEYKALEARAKKVSLIYINITLIIIIII